MTPEITATLFLRYICTLIVLVCGGKVRASPMENDGGQPFSVDVRAYPSTHPSCKVFSSPLVCR